MMMMAWMKDWLQLQACSFHSSGVMSGVWWRSSLIWACVWSVKWISTTGYFSKVDCWAIVRAFHVLNKEWLPLSGTALNIRVCVGSCCLGRYSFNLDILAMLKPQRGWNTFSCRASLWLHPGLHWVPCLLRDHKYGVSLNAAYALCLLQCWGKKISSAQSVDRKLLSALFRCA